MRLLQKKDQWLGVALVSVAAIIWGWQSPMMKGLYSQGIDVLSLILFRSLFSTATAAVFFFFYDKSIFRVDAKQLSFLCFYGTFVVAGTAVGFFFSLKYLSVSLGLLLHYTFPILTMFGSLILIREKPSRLQILSAFLILVGVGMGFTSSSSSAPLSLPGILWGLLAVVGISLQTLLGRITSKTDFIPQLTLLFYGFLCSTAAIAFIRLQVPGLQETVSSVTPYSWFLIFILGSLGTFFPQLLYFIALRKITAPLGSLVSSFELVSAILFSALMLNDTLYLREVAGSALVIFAIGMASFSD